MINGMYLSTMGALVQTARHGVVANNLANANTPGFKPDWTVFESLPAESLLQPGSRAEIDRILEQTGGGSWINQTATDFRPGVLRETGDAFDLALKQDEPGKQSFFMIRKEEGGDVFYTRAGDFNLDSNGRLATSEGYSVLGTDGAPIQLPAGAQAEIMEDGTIRDRLTFVALGQVGVVRTDQAGQLRKVGDSLYANETGEVRFENSQRNVVSGHVEDSGTVPVNEMVHMIEAQRTYEANMTFLRIQDEGLGNVVQRLGAINA